MASNAVGGLRASVGVDLRQNQLHHNSLSAGSGKKMNSVTMFGPQIRAPRAFADQSAKAEDHYYTLGVNPGSSEQDIKKAYRRLALEFHPDVCKADYCAAKFTQINKAYESAMESLSSLQDRMESCMEGLMGVNDDSWGDWEEWMGWEGAGSRDYSSHINHAL